MNDKTNRSIKEILRLSKINAVEKIEYGRSDEYKELIVQSYYKLEDFLNDKKHLSNKELLGLVAKMVAKSNTASIMAFESDSLNSGMTNEQFKAGQKEWQWYADKYDSIDEYIKSIPMSICSLLNTMSIYTMTHPKLNEIEEN